MDYIDDKAINAILDKSSELFESLSDDARKFIANNLDDDDIEDFYMLLWRYQDIIKERFYIEPEDEDDYAKLDLLKALLDVYTFLSDED